MNVTYDGGTGQQRALFQDALAHMQYPWDSLPVDIVVSFPVEPSLPGHKEYACTSSVGDLDHFAVEMRRSLDSTVSRNFYVESAAHELSHVIAFHYLNVAVPPVPLATIVTWFTKNVSGDGPVQGTVADMNPLGALWENRLQEGMAEILKDALLPEQYRDYDNRTNWKIDPAFYQQFMGLFINQIEGGPGTETVRNFSPPADSPGWTGPAPVSGVGLRYIDDRLGYLPQSAGYPRIRYSGTWPGHGPVSGLIDFPTFWTPGEHDGSRLLDTTHRQNIAFVGLGFDDTGVEIGPRVAITDPEGPLEGVPPSAYRTLSWQAFLVDYAGWVQLSQFIPDPTGNIPPWPYTDPQVSAGGGPWASVRFRTR